MKTAAAARPPPTGTGRRSVELSGRVPDLRRDARGRRAVPSPGAADRGRRPRSPSSRTSGWSPGSRPGPASAGLAAHFAHEWVILVNLFLLLVGFALLAAHFEESGLPKEFPAWLARRLDRRVRAARDRVRGLRLPRQHRRRPDRRRHGAHAVSRPRPRRLPRGHRRGLECGRRGKRHRRHHDDDDVDQRRRARRSPARLRGLRRRARRLRHCPRRARSSALRRSSRTPSRRSSSTGRGSRSS